MEGRVGRMQETRGMPASAGSNRRGRKGVKGHGARAAAMLPWESAQAATPCRIGSTMQPARPLHQLAALPLAPSLTTRAALASAAATPCARPLASS